MDTKALCTCGEWVGVPEEGRRTTCPGCKSTYLNPRLTQGRLTLVSNNWSVRCECDRVLLSGAHLGGKAMGGEVQCGHCGVTWDVRYDPMAGATGMVTVMEARRPDPTDDRWPALRSPGAAESAPSALSAHPPIKLT